MDEHHGLVYCYSFIAAEVPVGLPLVASTGLIANGRF